MYPSQSTQHIHHLLSSKYTFFLFCCPVPYNIQQHNHFNHFDLFLHLFFSFLCLLYFFCLFPPSFLHSVYIFLLGFVSVFYVPSFYTQWQIAATGDPCEDTSHFIHNCNEIILLLQRYSFSGCLSHTGVWF